MSKPSEKAIAAASKWTNETITLGDLAVKIATNSLALVIDTELEAQHRKTWALAMGKSAEYVAECLAAIGIPLRTDSIRELPCPPIEATKDK